MSTKLQKSPKKWARQLFESDPELANDLYFALDEIFVKKTEPHEQLTKIIHNWINPKEKSYGISTIEDAEDGSGDGILTFPEGMCEELGWNPGDTLNLHCEDDGTIIITKVS